MKLSLAMLFLLLVTSFAGAASTTPVDVECFAEIAETCIHLSGELDGTKTSEQRLLIKKTNRYCALAKRRFRVLDLKYQQDKKVQEMLNQYRDVLAE